MNVDSSELLAILLRESEAESFEAEILAAQPCRMSVANMFENSIVFESRSGDASPLGVRRKVASGPFQKELVRQGLLSSIDLRAERLAGYDLRGTRKIQSRILVAIRANSH